MVRHIKAMLMLVVLGLMAAAGPASGAQEKSFTLKQLGLTITLPYGLAIITRDEATHTDEELTEQFGPEASLDEMRADQVAEHTYLYAFSADWSFNMTIQHVNALRLPNVRDFREVDDDRLKELADQAASLSKMADPDLEIYSEGILRTPEAGFCLLRTMHPGDDGLQKHNHVYMTAHNDRVITVIFEGASPEALADQRPRQEKIIRSIVFSDVKTDPESTRPQ